jgi:hypothetical protein
MGVEVGTSVAVSIGVVRGVAVGVSGVVAVSAAGDVAVAEAVETSSVAVSGESRGMTVGLAGKDVPVGRVEMGFASGVAEERKGMEPVGESPAGTGCDP